MSKKPGKPCAVNSTVYPGSDGHMKNKGNISMQVERVDSEERFSALRQEWDSLVEADTQASIFSIFDFAHTAWQCFKSPSDRLFILLLRQEGVLTAIAPLRISIEKSKGIAVRVIRFIPEWRGDRPSIIAKESREAAWRSIYSYLRHEFREWDMAVFGEQRMDVPVPTNDVFPRFMYRVVAGKDADAYYVSFEGSFDEYAAGRKKRIRQNWRNRQRKLAGRAGKIEIECIDAPQEMDAALSRFIAIEQAGWKEGCEFSVGGSRQQEEFYKKLARTFSHKKRIKIYFLRADGRDIAGEILFAFKDILYSVHLTYDEEFARYSPGILLQLQVMERNFNSSYKTFDVLGVRESANKNMHKRDIATGIVATKRIVFYKWHVRVVLYRILQMFKKIINSRMISSAGNRPKESSLREKEESATHKDSSFLVTTAVTADDVRVLSGVCSYLEPYPITDVGYLLVKTSQRDDIEKPVSILLSDDGVSRTMLAGCIEKKEFDYAFFKKSLFRVKVRSLRVVFGGVMGDPSFENSFVLMSELFKVMKKENVDIIFFENIPTQSAFCRAAKKSTGFLWRDHIPERSFHYKMTLPVSMDEFYRARKKKKHLFRILRRLDDDFSHDHVIKCFEDMEDVEQFCNDAHQVSMKTYQFELGAGFRNDAQTLACLSHLAEKRAFRAYILYIQGKPRAFEGGWVYKDTFYSQYCGYDRDYSKYELGTILMLKVIEDLCADERFKYMDNGWMDTFYKRRFCDTRWEEENFRVYAPTLKGVFLNTMRTAAGMARYGKSLIIRNKQRRCSS